MGSVSGAVLGAALVLKVVVTVLTDSNRRRDLQPLDLRLEAAAPAGRAGGKLASSQFETGQLLKMT